MVLQAFIDESYDRNGVCVLAGYVATAETWARFSKEWGELLPAFGTRARNGKFHFHMNEMARRLDKVEPFFRVIERYDLFEMFCKIDISDLRRAIDRIYVPDLDINWGMMENFYVVSFRTLVDAFHANREMIADYVPLGEKVDFIFDDKTEKRALLGAWEGIVKKSEFREYYGATPRFENDQDFLPLQAADFSAWWIRKRFAEGIPWEPRNFGPFKATKKQMGLSIITDEDGLVTKLSSAVRELIEPGRAIYDVKFSPPFSPERTP